MTIEDDHSTVQCARQAKLLQSPAGLESGVTAPAVAEPCAQSVLLWQHVAPANSDIPVLKRHNQHFKLQHCMLEK